MVRKLIFIGIIFFIVIVFLSSLSIYLPKTTLAPDSKNNTSLINVIAENLDTPWGMVFLPDKSILFTERAGRVRFIDSKEVLKESPILILKDVKEVGEGGLLGIVIHPDFAKNSFVYLYYTYTTNEGTFNKVVKFRYGVTELAIACLDKDPNCNKASTPTLEEDEIIVDKIPSAANHNGGRIKFGPDGYLYITTGDAQNPSQAQNTNSLSGKILRVTDEGKPVSGNPFNNLVYSYGHRNSQGLAWDSQGRLWATEHGRSGALSGLDEINLVELGKNYGWPIIQGDEAKEGMVAPKINSGFSVTWAPSGAAFVNNSLFFGGLRGQTLYEAEINGDKIILKEHFKGEFGRIREVILGPDNFLYITTSNKDGRGNPKSWDDRIIKINPIKL